MRLKLKENPRDWQKFTLAVVAALSLASFVAYRRHSLTLPTLRWLLCLAGLVCVVCGARPAWFRGFYRVGMTAGFHLGQVVTRVLLTVMFFLVVTPLGWVLRLTGKDLLRLKRDPQARSYWRPVKPNPHFDRLF